MLLINDTTIKLTFSYLLQLENLILLLLQLLQRVFHMSTVWPYNELWRIVRLTEGIPRRLMTDWWMHLIWRSWARRIVIVIYKAVAHARAEQWVVALTRWDVFTVLLMISHNLLTWRYARVDFLQEIVHKLSLIIVVVRCEWADRVYRVVGWELFSGRRGCCDCVGPFREHVRMCRLDFTVGRIEGRIAIDRNHQKLTDKERVIREETICSTNLLHLKKGVNIWENFSSMRSYDSLASSLSYWNVSCEPRRVALSVLRHTFFGREDNETESRSTVNFHSPSSQISTQFPVVCHLWRLRAWWALHGADFSSDYCCLLSCHIFCNSYSRRRISPRKMTLAPWLACVASYCTMYHNEIKLIDLSSLHTTHEISSL